MTVKIPGDGVSHAQTGDCTVMYEGDGLCVIRADPRVWISREMVERLDTFGSNNPRVTWLDDVLTIDAVNQRVVYRVHRDKLDDTGLCYLAEWPD